MADRAMTGSSRKMNTKEPRPSNNLFQQAISGSATAREELFQKLSERFLHLAQNILCDREAAVAVTNKAMERIRREYKKLFKRKKPAQATQKVLDGEIEVYFQGLIKEIKSGFQESEQRLLDILKKRFLFLTEKRFATDKQIIASADVEDIVQNALLTVAAKCQTAQPQGTFIQWAQTVLKNKYLEQRRAKLRRGEGPLVEQNEASYTKTISDFVKRGRIAKEANEQEIESAQREIPEQSVNDPFEEDPYQRDLIQVIESSDLKRRLVTLVAEKMGKQCKRVFKVLFSEGDRKFMHKEFPEKSPQQIDITIAKCRKRLKELAQKEGVL